MVIIGEQGMFNFKLRLAMFISLGVERTGRQMEADLNSTISESLKIRTTQLLEVVDNKMLGICNTLEGVSDRPYENVQNPLKNIETRGIDSVQSHSQVIIHTTPERFIC